MDDYALNSLDVLCFIRWLKLISGDYAFESYFLGVVQAIIE